MALKSWAEASASPAYQNADENTKAQMRDQYVKAGGTIPTAQAPAASAPQQDEGIIHDAASGVTHFLQGTAAGVGRQAARGIGGLVEAAENTLGTGSTYGKRIQQNADQTYQRHMQEAGGGTAAQLGSQWGTTGANIAGYVLAPEAMIPAQAALAGGEAYANQAPGDKSLARAGLVGAANYAAGRILPGAGGEAAEGLINQAIAGAKTVGRNALAGAKGGAAVGAANVINQEGENVNAGDVLTGAIEGGVEGGAFGGAIGGGHALLGKAASKVSSSLNREGATPSPTADISKPAQADAIAGSEFLANRGIPLTDARLHGNAEAQAAFGKTQADVDASRSADRAERLNTRVFGLDRAEVPEGSLNQTKEVWEREGKKLVNDISTSLDSIDKSVKGMKNQWEEYAASSATSNSPRQAAAAREELSSLNQFEKDFTNYRTQMSKAGQEGERQTLLEELANKAQNSFEKLHPDTQAQLKQDYIPVEGLGEGFNFANEAKTYGNGLQQLTQMHPTFRSTTTNATKASEVDLNVTSPLKSARSIWNMTKSAKARDAFQKEQAAALDNTRALAAGMRRAEETVAANRPDPTDPNPPEVKDDIGLQMSEEAPAPTAQATADIKEAPAARPSPDQTAVYGNETPAQRYRRMKAEADEVQRQAQAQAEAPQAAPEAPQGPTAADLARRPAAPQQAAPEAPQAAPEPAPQQEPLPVDITFNREQARAAFKRAMGREPTTQEVQEAEAAQRAAMVEQLKNRMANAQEFARGRPTQPEAPVTEAPAQEVPVQEAPAPEPVPQPDQVLARQPVRPEGTMTEEPIPQPEPEPAPAPSPDQVLTQQPTRPEAPQPEPEVVPEAPAPEEPVTPPEAPKPEPDQALTRKPKAAEKPAEEPTEAPKEEAPKESPSWLSGHAKRVAERTLGAVKKMFTTDKVRSKITIENMEDQNFLKQMRREDAAENIDQIHHAVEQANKMRLTREEKQHELNVNELDRWSKAENIDPKYVNQAIKDMGLEKARILGVNSIKVRATKAYLKDLAASAPREEVPESVDTGPTTTLGEQRKAFTDEILKMHPDVQKDVMPVLESSLKAAGKVGDVLRPSEVRSTWKKIYNAAERSNTKLNKAADAAAAKAKADKLEEQEAQEASKKAAAENARKTTEAEAARIKSLNDRMEQRERVEKVMRDQMKGLPESEQTDLINSFTSIHMQDLNEPLPNRRFQDLVTKAGEKAEAYAQNHKAMDAIDREKAHANEAAQKELDALKSQVEELNKRIQSTNNVGEARAAELKEVSGEMIERAVDALENFKKNDSGIKAINDAVDLLAKAYGRNEVEALPLFNFAKSAQKAVEMAKKYPNNPEVWISQSDARSVKGRADVAAGNTLMTRLTESMLGKRYDQIKLLTEAERNARVDRLKNGERLSEFNLGTSGQKREAALRAGGLTQPNEASVKPKATIKKAVSAEDAAIKKQAAKIKRMKARLNNEEAWIHDDDRGTKWKAYQSQLRTEEYNLAQLKKGKK